MLMTWDPIKREKNLLPEPAGHGMDFADARDRFEWETAMISETYASAHGGKRFTAVGFLDGKLVALIFSPLGTEAISAISLRTASNRERKTYAER